MAKPLDWVSTSTPWSERRLSDVWSVFLGVVVALLATFFFFRDVPTNRRSDNS
jgi:hypothetical protein